jgi:hypothetical protein
VGAMRILVGPSAANHPRIMTFPFKDTMNCYYASDVISFARARDIFPARTRVQFPITMRRWISLRACGRIWSVFNRVSGS